MTYYFLAASFEPISIASAPKIDFQELLDLLKTNLSHRDMRALEEVLFLSDMENVHALCQGAPIIGGRLSQEELEDCLLFGVYDGVSFEQMRPFVEFFDQYSTNNERLEHFSKLYVDFFARASSTYTGFLGSYFAFERGLRMVLTALRAKALQRDLIHELRYEDPSDPLFAWILAQKDAKANEFPEPYTTVAMLFANTGTDPILLLKNLAQFRLEKIEELVEGHIFDFDAIAAYLVSYIIVERLFHMDDQYGQALIEKVITT